MPRAGLTTDAVVDLALGLVDEKRLDALSLAAVADRAGAVMGRSRGDAVVALMRAYRGYVLANPGRYALMPLDPLRRAGLVDASTELLGVFVAVMRGYGLDDEQSIHAIRRLRAAAHGFTDIESRGGFGQPEDIDTTYEGGHRHVPEEPAVTARSRFAGADPGQAGLLARMENLPPSGSSTTA